MIAPDLYQVMNEAIKSSMSDLHTITIAKITKVNASTVNCLPVISRVLDNNKIDLPEFIEVPVITLQGGTSYTSFPIATGDYCLLFFTERCFDRWYAGQDFQKPLEARMHDYSDGIALVGVNPLSKAIAIPSTIKTIGTVEHEGDYNQTGNNVIVGNNEASSYSVGGVSGVSGSFTTADSKTVTVINGLITNIA